jgi:V/A-type H+-transporting ATPase subunit I
VAVEKELHRTAEELSTAVKEVKDKLGHVKKEAADMLVAAEEHLSIEVEKLESPLRYGGTANATFIEGWVPSSRMDGLELTLTRTVGDAYHMEVLDDGKVRPQAHGHGEAHVAEVANDGGQPVEEPPEEGTEGSEDAKAKAHEAEDDDVEPPVLLRNPTWALPYEMLVTEVSTPSYKELDPSVFMFITFPLFFGMMMGDIAYGLLTAVGAYIVGGKVRNVAVKKVASMLFVSGVLSIVWGFIYGEFFGFELYGHKGLLYHHDLYIAALDIYLPINRFDEAMLLIKVCLYLGIIHLISGLIIGFYNERITHGSVHAFLAKGSWIMILIGGTIAVSIALAGTVDWGDPGFLLGMILLIGGIVALVVGEGPIGILHVPGILSNVLSYIRIFALGLAAVGIALTFNQIAAPMWEQGGAMAVMAILVGVMGHLLNLFLGILGPVMHSLRLHYVEWMTKFYTGGGAAYKPFGRTRKYTEA